MTRIGPGPCTLRLCEDGKLQFQVVDDAEIPNKWHKNPISVAVVRGTQDLPDNHELRLIINLGLLTWQKEMGLKIIQVKSTDTPDVTVKFMPASEDPYFAGDGAIIAWAGFPETSLQGQMHFNDDYIFTKDGEPIRCGDALARGLVKGCQVPDNMLKTINLNQTFTHEFGHILGFVHIETCPLCVMYNYYNGVLELQPVEKTRAVAKYGPNTKGMTWYQRISAWLQYRLRHE